MIKAVVFDFDGTLIDSTESIWKEYKNVANKMGLKGISYKEFKAQLGKPWDKVLKTLWPNVDVSEFSKIYRQDKEDTKLIAHVPETLDTLSKTYRLALLTSRGGKTLSKIIKSCGITEDRFEVIIHKDTLTSHKPDPKALKHLLNIMKLKPDEVVYVGDSIVDAEFAKASNVLFVGVLTGGATKKEFESLGVKHIIT